MKVRERSDPRLETLFGLDSEADGGVRPIIPLPRRGLPTWIFVAAALVGAALLFAVMESRRAVRRAGSASSPQLVAAAAPAPELYIPPALRPPEAISPGRTVATAEVTQPPVRPSVAIRSVPASSAPPASIHYPVPVVAMPALPQQMRSARTGAAPFMDPDTGSETLPNSSAPDGAQALGQAGAGRFGTRIRASTLANRSNTVVQGTMIPAILETAFNSTQAGYARAIVSRDVHGFDGTQVLVPRGSRLIGEYRADVAAGQRRAVISWGRLIRPDGVTINLNSPAVDPLGRGGVPAEVNSHFLERFSGAVLQSILSLGGNIATRSVTGGVIVAVPGGTAGSAMTSSSQAVPTLSVPAGRSISVFVAHDLEFPLEGQL